VSRLVGQELSGDLFEHLCGDDIKGRAGQAIIVITVGEDGWAHPAMLSYHEVVAKSRSRIDLAVGKNSSTARNLRRTGRVTLVITDRETNFYVKSYARETYETMTEVSFMSLFRAEVGEVTEDQEPGATILTGVTFERSEKSGIEISEKIFARLRREP
jgi:flavin reductase (DIM6/NTAB) family NADH-FMN oxidoreductase RutF